MDSDNPRISIASLIFVALLITSSQFWLTRVQLHWMDEVHDIAIDVKESGEEPIWDPGREILNVPENLYTESDVIRRLRRENALLKKSLSSLQSLRKAVGEDGMALNVEVLSRVYRTGLSTAIINAGADYGIREGDWLLDGDKVCGKVLAVFDRSALVSDLSFPEVKAFVTVGGIPGHYVWAGQGEGRGQVRVRRDSGEALMHRDVYLSGASSLEGSLWVGKVTEIRNDRRGGWQLLVVEGRKIKPDANLFVYQRQESTDRHLFAQRDRLHELKQEIRKIELNKLRMESLLP